MTVFEKRSVIPCSAERLFRWHAAPRAFQRLSPPFEDAVLIKPLARLADGEEAIIEVGVGPLRIRWVARHEKIMNGQDGGVAGFDDVMITGPASSWRHEHRFEPIDDDTCTLVDRITWTAPPGGGLVVGPKLERMFRYRHALTIADLTLERSLRETKGLIAPAVVAVSGSTGLIGSEVCALLSVMGHEIRPLHRVKAPGEPAPNGTIAWHPATGTIDVVAANGVTALVHLAGENIGEGRLNDAKKERLRRQRVDQTAALLDAFAALPAPPSVVLGACAVGFYGDRDDNILDEDSPAGDGFLADFCVAWEGALLAPRPWRQVAMRVGIVLSPKGGALGTVLPIFKAGAGGPLADGRAYMPTIGVDDIADVVAHALADERTAGIVNAVGPTPLRNSEYTSVLGSVLGRPAFVPVPRFALRLALGDMGDHVVDSMRVLPTKLTTLGHHFRHPDTEHALRHLLGYPQRKPKGDDDTTQATTGSSAI